MSAYQGGRATVGKELEWNSTLYMIFKNQLHVLIELLAVHGKLKGIVPTCSHEVEFVLANRILAVAPIKNILEGNMPRSKGNWAGWFKRREKKKSKRPTLEKLNSYLSGIGYVVGESRNDNYQYTRSHILNNADDRQKNPTRAEKKLETILNELGGGSLKGKFSREHVISGKWIVDFFFHEIRLAIEVDGSSHNSNYQKQKDAIKELDARRLYITVLRITNSQVFGNRQDLVNKLRGGWQQALNMALSLKHYGPDTAIKIKNNRTQK